MTKMDIHWNSRFEINWKLNRNNNKIDGFMLTLLSRKGISISTSYSLMVSKMQPNGYFVR